MKRIAAVLLLSLPAIAQTVYLRTSPGGNVITNATWNGTTYQITTQFPHGHSAGNIVIVWSVCTNS